MSFITRRALSTLIPPKVASPSGLGAAQDAVRMKRVVDFYEKLPRGSAPQTQAKGFINKYKAKHFSGDKASAMPIIHVVGILVLVGYAQNYYFHLRHHKNNAH